MKLVESILTKNPCYTAGRKITVKGLMLHSVGCPQPKASVFINSWNSPSYDNACVHGFIDGNDGTVYQTLPWNHRGWHCGSGSKGSGNNTHIGVEMCEPACIKYTSGANFTCSDTATAKAVAKRTYEAAVELFAMLCKQYSLNPTADGVIISHREGHSRGIASNHGDPEHLWTQLGMGYTMDTFRQAVKAAMDGGSSAETSGYTKIMGNAVATAEQMKTYIQGKNPQVPQSVLDMIPLYLSEGQTEGVRGDIAFAQSCLETGNFTFSDSAVTLDQNNFCGMGVTSNGLKGNSFDTPQLGIRAQIQHLKAYASTDALKNDCVDPRFKYVTRGSAEYVEWLGQQENPQGKGWAAGAGYGEKILTTDSTFNFLISMIYTQLFNLLCEKADDVYGGRLPVHVRCLIDEAANIGQIPNLEKLVATIRSREISACLVLQAQSQLKALYKDNADTIIGNMDSRIFLGGSEPTTLKELNQSLGKETIDTFNTGESRGREVSHSLNYQKLGKDLATIDELAVLDGGKCILQLRGVRPFLSDKFDITKHPNYKYLSDASPKNSFDIEKYLSTRLKTKPDDVYEVYEVDASDESATA